MNPIVLRILFSMTIFSSILLTIDSSKCKSILWNDLTEEEFEWCWRQFCTCARFDNCSKVGNGLDDVLMLIHKRLNIVRCGRMYRTFLEEGMEGIFSEFKVKFIDQSMAKISIEYEVSEKGYRKPPESHFFYPAVLYNYFWGFNIQSKGLITGNLRFRNQ